MSAGQFLQSENGRFRLMLQSDGNLVLKDGEAIIWIADANQPYSATLHPKKMREPLQFVISNSGFLYDPPGDDYGSRKARTAPTSRFGTTHT